MFNAWNELNWNFFPVFFQSNSIRAIPFRRWTLRCLSVWSSSWSSRRTQLFILMSAQNGRAIFHSIILEENRGKIKLVGRLRQRQSNWIITSNYLYSWTVPCADRRDAADSPRQQQLYRSQCSEQPRNGRISSSGSLSRFRPLVPSIKLLPQPGEPRLCLWLDRQDQRPETSPGHKFSPPSAAWWQRRRRKEAMASRCFLYFTIIVDIFCSVSRPWPRDPISEWSRFGPDGSGSWRPAAGNRFNLRWV